MIHYLRHDKIDRNKWDLCIDHATNSNIYAYSWYLDCVCEHWDALVEEDYESVMPLPYRRKMRITYVFPPSMTQQLGVFSAHTISQTKLQEFIEAIPDKFKFCRINLNHGNTADAKLNNLTSHTNLELELDMPYQNLFELYSENTQRNIKKAAKFKLSINKKGNISHLIHLFSQNKAKTLDSLPEDFYPILRKVYKMLNGKNRAQLWEVYRGNELCAGVFFGFAQQKAYLLFSAANEKAKESSAMHFLIDSFIHEHESSNLTLDFEGSDSLSLARFYRSFGALEKNYDQILINKLPFIVNSFMKIIRKGKK